MAQPEYLLIDIDELEEHHKYLLRSGLGNEEFLESEWNHMGFKLKNFLSLDGRPRTIKQETTGSESRAMRLLRVLCCNIILPSIRGRESRSTAADSTEPRPYTKSRELPPASAAILAKFREKRKEQETREKDEAFFRHHKVERYDWSKYDPDASDDDVDVWKIKPSTDMDEISMASYEPCFPSEYESSIHEPSFPSDFGSSTLSLKPSFLMCPEQPRLPAVCAKTVPPVLSNRSLDPKGAEDSADVSRQTRCAVVSQKAHMPEKSSGEGAPKPGRKHLVRENWSINPPRPLEPSTDHSSSTPFSSGSSKSGSTSGVSSSSVVSDNSGASTIRPRSLRRSERRNSIVTVIGPETPKTKVSLSRGQPKQKPRLVIEPPSIQPPGEIPPMENMAQPPPITRSRNHSRRKSLQMPLASPRIGDGSRPPLCGSAYEGSRNYCGCDSIDCRECRNTTTLEKYFPFEQHGGVLPKRDSTRQSLYYT
ncbi:hypothetical protein PGQ11_011550 [Apiospora arundinis]|uniref:Uncharacterized protein n=1 Tax=Apiospora arundinis TaxID=335852 RepID=A0ABR2HZY1_9PEZI